MIKNLICIACPIGCRLEIDIDNDYTVTGNQCNRGIDYGKQELISPTRIVTTTVKIKGALHKRLPVKTEQPIPKELIFKCMNEINKVVVISPIKTGDIILENILNTKINVVATRDM